MQVAQRISSPGTFSHICATTSPLNFVMRKFTKYFLPAFNFFTVITFFFVVIFFAFLKFFFVDKITSYPLTFLEDFLTVILIFFLPRDFTLLTTAFFGATAFSAGFVVFFFLLLSVFCYLSVYYPSDFYYQIHLLLQY